MLLCQFCEGTGIDTTTHPYVMEDIAVAAFVNHTVNLPEGQ